MISEKVTTEYKKNITRGAIEIVEKKYISSSANISNVIIEYLHCDYGLVSQCFKEVTGLSLAKYAKRRKYTELYCKHKKEFDGYKYDATVDGVRCFKKKVWQEFGNPISELQNKIDVDDSEAFICNKEMERVCKKKIRKIKKNRAHLFRWRTLVDAKWRNHFARLVKALYRDRRKSIFIRRTGCGIASGDWQIKDRKIRNFESASRNLPRRFRQGWQLACFPVGTESLLCGCR
jgi:hypothetical protein